MGTGMGGFDRGNSKERGSFDSDVLLKFLKGLTGGHHGCTTEQKDPLEAGHGHGE